MSRESIPLLLLVFLSFLPLRLIGAEDTDSHTALRKLAEQLETALKAKPSAELEVDLKRLRDAGLQAVLQLGPDHLGAERLREVIESTEPAELAELDQAVGQLRKSMRELHEALTFKPVIEAEMPEAFPAWTPVGNIELKKYPGYRMARYAVEQGVGENSAFMTLFEHIKTNRIEMTAPVKMEYQLAEDARLRQLNMAFLYSSQQLGSVGKDALGVQVSDVPAEWVLSIGVRGPTSAEQIESSRKALKAWLERHRADYESAGPLRVMGYNSPFVFGDRRYFEVQIPVQKKSSPEDEE